MTMDFGSELTDEVWAFIKELFLENDEYVINDDEHTVSMIMIIEEPLPIEDCEIHVDKKRLKLQNGEMAIILFKVELGEDPPEEEPKEE
jgi:hypothetical protein